MIDISPLLEEIERRGLSQVGVAMKAGVHTNTVFRFLKRENITMDSLEAIANGLGFEVVFVKKKQKPSGRINGRFIPHSK